ncbi:uncharacterized protein [Mycetomoellerius zeteki]|uniref:uncharacterized protein n=1 Tax=Mycetomoellerius zeteki TaxID=64791 RepID=UPI00084E7684|nr:PREDICTED: uncharacterized protein LOC108722730 [Trachymyrmex zeteki]
MLKVQEKIVRKCGYCGYYLPQSYDLMKHSCFYPFDDEINAFNVDENSIVTVVVREEYDNNLSEPGTNTCQLTNNEDDVQQEVNIDELLITCVARKLALFDHRIPANERSNLKKKGVVAGSM